MLCPSIAFLNKIISSLISRPCTWFFFIVVSSCYCFINVHYHLYILYMLVYLFQISQLSLWSFYELIGSYSWLWNSSSGLPSWWSIVLGEYILPHQWASVPGRPVAFTTYWEYGPESVLLGAQGLSACKDAGFPNPLSIPECLCFLLPLQAHVFGQSLNGWAEIFQLLLQAKIEVSPNSQPPEVQFQLLGIP